MKSKDALLRKKSKTEAPPPPPGTQCTSSPSFCAAGRKLKFYCTKPIMWRMPRSDKLL